MIQSSTNHTKPFTLALGIAFAMITLAIVGFALINGGLDVRSRAATVTRYTCMPQRECAGVGSVVSKVYCGGNCSSSWQCCKTTTVMRVTPTPVQKVFPTPTRYIPMYTPTRGSTIQPTRARTPTPTRRFIPTPTRKQ